MLIFLICWLLGLIFWVWGMVVRRKLRTELESNHPSIRCHLKSGFGSMDNIDISKGSKTLFFLIISFGARKAVNNYLNVFIDIDEIEKLERTEAKKLLNKLHRVTSSYARVWVIAVLSIILGIITFPSELGPN